MKSVGIERAFLPWMEAAGLAGFRDFFEKPVGEPLSLDGNGRELRRISIEAEGVRRTFYLKRIGREPFAKLAQMLLFGCRPRSGPLRELRLLQELQQAGFATMRQVAWGEKRLLGWPVGGFLLVEQVAGTEVADLFEEGDPELLRRLCHDLGAYLGRLHQAGFFQVVRLKDLFCPAVPTGAESGFAFVLIDRETSKPRRKRFSVNSAFHALARAARRVLRDGFRLRRAELRSFFQGYLAGSHLSVGGMTGTDFRKAFFSALRKELKGRRKSGRRRFLL